jgi:hypothetical protein
MKSIMVLLVLIFIFLFIVLPIGVIYYFVKRSRKPSVRKDQILEDWQALIEKGKGSAEDVYKAMISSLEESKAPGVTWERQEIEAGQMLMRKSYNGLVVTNSSLEGFVAYVFAYDYGTALHVAWFLSMKASFLKQVVIASVLQETDPRALVRYLPIYQQLELSAYTTVVHTAIKKAVAYQMGKLNQDISSINTKSKGFLEVW